MIDPTWTGGSKSGLDWASPATGLLPFTGEREAKMNLILSSDDPGQQAADMAVLYPGVKFIPHRPTPLELEAVRRGMPVEILLPHAIFEYEGVEARDDYAYLKSLIRSFQRCALDGVASMTALALHSGLSFASTFEALKGAYFNDDTYIVRFSLEHDPGQDGALVYTLVTRLEYRTFRQGARR